MIKVGDVVQLKSGGPIMTVTSEDAGSPSRVRCHWFTGYAVKSDIFGPDSLVIVTAGDKWDGVPPGNAKRGGLHLLFDEEGDLTVARWGWQDGDETGHWQTLGNSQDASPVEIAFSGWKYARALVRTDFI